MTKFITEQQLDEFIIDVDSIGPSTAEFNKKYKDFQYLPSVTINQELNPYDDSYMNCMMKLYEEIAKKKYDPKTSELTDFDMAEHSLAPTPYGNVASTALALHFQRLSFAIRKSKPIEGLALDMGCGWGLSSEFLAQLGYAVTAVDINEKFIELVKTRADRFGHTINAICSNFQAYHSNEKYSLILFYECFHHEREPWILIEKLTSMLDVDGKILLIGEPIQDRYWRNWGLRLDPLSVYCIGKFGWFESGWSMEFLRNMFARFGLFLITHANPDPDVGVVMIGEFPNRYYGIEELEGVIEEDQWWREGDFLVSKGYVQLKLIIPSQVSFLIINIFNFRGANVDYKVALDGSNFNSGVLEVGENEIKIPVQYGNKNVEIYSDTWCPNNELQNGDGRIISFHFKKFSFE